jgi:Tfp pilus assembly protein PilV
MRKQRGLTFLEILISLIFLTLFILGGMSLYASSLNQTKKSHFLLTELWLGKGKLDSMAGSGNPLLKTSGKFSPPFRMYSWNIKKQSLQNHLALHLLKITVKGPEHTKITLERIMETSDE